MKKQRNLRNATMVSVLALSVAISACNSNDDDDPVTSNPADDATTAAAGEAGATAGEAGSTAGEAGSTAGEAGATAGEAGSTAGEAGATAGEAGSTAGEAGATATAGINGSTAGEAGDTVGSGAAGANPDISTAAVALDSTSTVPPANVDGAAGEGSFSVDTSTGAVSGSITVSGTTDTPTAAHLHSGAAGAAGPVLVPLVSSDDGTVWTAGDDEALDAAGIAAFEAGEVYVNVHTAAHPDGELRAQLVPANADAGTTSGDTAGDDTAGGDTAGGDTSGGTDVPTDEPAAGSVTISFTNTSATMPMTPPVVALHNAPGADNGVRLFEVGQPASLEIIEIAENGLNHPLVSKAVAEAENGSVTAAGEAFTDAENPGPLLPGASSSINLDLVNADQVLSVVSMIACSNDGFSGIDSRPLSGDATETFMAPIYDAGSESNVLQLDYWVDACGGTGNRGDDENGSITAHPGQSEAENADFNFEAGAQLLEITVTRN